MESGRRLDNDRRSGRIVEDLRVRQPGLDVTARPVDTYVRPAESKAGKLAEALAGVQPGLSQFSEVLSTRMIEADTEAGVAAANKMAAEGKAWGDAVRNEEIPSMSSPWFKAAMNEQLGRVGGAEAAAAFDEALKASPEMNRATSLEEFDAFQGKFISEWVKSKGGFPDGRAEAAFSSYLTAHVANRSKPAFIKVADTRLKKQAHDLAVSEQANHLLDVKDNPEEQLRGLKEMRQYLYNAGRSLEQVDASTIDAVVQYAEKTKDPTALDILEKVSGSTGTTLSLTPEGHKAISDAEDRIFALNERERREAKRQAEAEYAEVQSKFDMKVLELQQSDPDADYSALFKDPEFRKHAAKLATHAKGFASDLNSLATADDNQFHAMRIGILNGTASAGDILTNPLLTRKQRADLYEKLNNNNIRMANINQKRLQNKLKKLEMKDLTQHRLVEQWRANLKRVIPAAAAHNGGSWLNWAEAEFNEEMLKLTEQGELDLNSGVTANKVLSNLVNEIGGFAKPLIEGDFGFKEFEFQGNTAAEVNSTEFGTPASTPENSSVVNAKATQQPDLAQKVQTISAEEKDAAAAEFMRQFNNDEAKAKAAYFKWLEERTK